MICQSLRLLGGTEIETIACDRLDEQDIVYWDDIEQVFPGVQYVKNGNHVVGLLRGPDRPRIVPNCIKFYPDVTLDVVLSPVTLVQDVQSQIPTDKDNGRVEPPRDLSYLLRTYGAQLEILDFQKIRLDDMALRALAKSIKYGSSLKEVLFPLYRPNHKSEHLDNKSVASIADIVARSALHTFRIDLGQEDTRVRILDAIQWRHLRKLIVVDNDENQGIGMRAIVESMARWPGELDLEYFHYGARGTTEDQQRFLRQSVSSVPIKHLEISVDKLTCEQGIEICNSVDFSRMEYFFLAAEGWSSSDAQAFLDVLLETETLRLHTVVMRNAVITQGLEDMMLARGIKLARSR
ncbi:hypothetical protein BGZ80_006988 [Entomortierella chlamydospora]|uniref:Uncharacterized protein n=1 Tax=Entomortierella chlamydospora TaxID=101097 RepID=A0A9P6MZQ2_9FUNG|nr:hypothetical protein BGZ79_007519 [Entomortierella chlamydospora]KAG0018606.1 hypothetical protein BGZ80_006988 [Entomortierella chlamydospora]